MSIDGREKFSRLIREARGNRTKVEFARLLGVSHTTVGSWENGDRFPEREKLVTLCHVLGYSLEEMQEIIDGKSRDSVLVSLQKVKSEIESLPVVDQIEVYKFLSDRVVAMAGGR